MKYFIVYARNHMSNANFKQIKQKQIFEKLSKRIAISPSTEANFKEEANAALPSNGVIENFIDTTDFFILAMQDGEFLGGLSSELKFVLDEQADILLATTNEEEARKAFEEFENEEVYEGEIPAEAETPSMTTTNFEAWFEQAEKMGLEVKELTALSGEGTHFVAKDKEGNQKGEFDPSTNKGEFTGESGLNDDSVVEQVQTCMDILEKAFISLPDGDLRANLFNIKSQLYSVKRDMDSGALANVVEAAKKKAPSEKIKNDEEAKQKISEIISKYFPNSKFRFRNIMGKSQLFVTFTYGKELSDYPSRIEQNDIMYSSFALDGFDNKTGELEVDKLQLKDNGWNTGGLKINGSTVKRFNWKNVTLSSGKVLEKIESYFKEASEFLETEEGKKILETYKKRLD